MRGEHWNELWVCWRHSSGIEPAVSPTAEPPTLTADILMLPSQVVPPVQRTTIHRFTCDFRTKFCVFEQNSVCDKQKKLMFIARELPLSLLTQTNIVNVAHPLLLPLDSIVFTFFCFPLIFLHYKIFYSHILQHIYSSFRKNHL